MRDKDPKETEIQQVDLAELFDRAWEIFARVRDSEESFLVMKQGRPLALITPVPEELLEQIAARRVPDIPGLGGSASKRVFADPVYQNVKHVEFKPRR